MTDRPAKPSRSIAVRLVAAAVVWIVAALVAGGFLLSNVFRTPLETAFDQRLDYLLQSLLSAAEIDEDGRIVEVRSFGEPRFESQYSGLYWQIERVDGEAAIARSRSLWDFELEIVEALPVGTTVSGRLVQGPLDQQLRVSAIRITDENTAGAYDFIVAADIGDLLVSINAFHVTLVWSLGVLGAGLILAVILQVYVGLLPLRRLRQALQAVRDGREERLDSDFPNEVKPLADELNGLLDHTQAVLARARAHVGNLAHALKTPLSVLANEGASPTPELSGTVRQQTELMRRQIDHHLSRARAVGQTSPLRAQVPVNPAMLAIVRTLEKLHADRSLTITVDCEDELAFRGEQNDLEEMLGNLCDNACKWARGRVHIRATALAAKGGPRLDIVIEDDGPGIPAEQRNALFDRGRRADESKPGSGLGLAIVRDIAGLYGGDVALDAAEGGGLRVTLTLPGGRLNV